MRVIVEAVQERGKHRGRQHLRAVVLAPDDQASGRVHRIRWYTRKRRGGP